MIIRTVGRKHPICRAVFEGAAARFWDAIELSPVPHALVVYVSGRPVAWHRYAFDRRKKHFFDAGIWVAPHFRGRGLARSVYAEALRRTGARVVTVATVSKSGRALIAGLVLDLPKIAWCIEAQTWER